MPAGRTNFLGLHPPVPHAMALIGKAGSSLQMKIAGKKIKWRNMRIRREGRERRSAGGLPLRLNANVRFSRIGGKRGTCFGCNGEKLERGIVHEHVATSLVGESLSVFRGIAKFSCFPLFSSFLRICGDSVSPHPPFPAGVSAWIIWLS